MFGALAMERIKFFSVRSTYWCLGAMVVLCWGITLLAVVQSSTSSWTMATAQVSTSLAFMIYLALATVVMTSEYRTGTIRVTFQAVASRDQVYLAKAILVVLMGLGIGLLLALGNIGIVKALTTGGAPQVALLTSSDWRYFVGPAVLLAGGGLLALGVGTLIRYSAGAITGLLIYALLIESLVMAFASGREVAGYLPVNAGFQFVNPPRLNGLFGRVALYPAPGPGTGLAIFAATAVLLWLAGLVALRARDA